jgi:hypothetical protein
MSDVLDPSTLSGALVYAVVFFGTAAMVSASR